MTYEDGVKCNPAEFKSCDRPALRDIFFGDMNAMEFADLEKKYASPIKISFFTRVKRKVKRIVKSAFNKNRGGARTGVTKNMDYCLCFVFDCKEKN